MDEQYDKAEDEERPGTHRLNAEESSIIPDRQGWAYGTTIENPYAELQFLPLPEPSRRRSASLAKPWLLVLSHPNPSVELIGLEIYDDVVLGRAERFADAPDLDLSNYDAATNGVSRRHAMLRPTRNQLFLIDLGSTNGSAVNAFPQSAGIARALSQGDQVTLGELHLKVLLLTPPDPE